MKSGKYEISITYHLTSPSPKKANSYHLVAGGTMRRLIAILFALLLPGIACADYMVVPGTTFTKVPTNQLSPTPMDKLEILANIKVNRPKLEATLRALPLQIPELSYSLLQYQTPNRSQVGNDGLDTGACPAFAMVAAIEAYYKRDCMRMHPGVNPPTCDIDLSEDYLIHLNSQVSTLNNQVEHENLSSFCGTGRGLRYDWQGPGGFGAYVGKAIPTENGADGALASVTAKDQFAKQTNLYHICRETQQNLNQEDIDAYEYDYSHFSADLRKRAVHAVEDYVAVDFSQPANIEKLIYNEIEVIAAHSWDHIVEDGKDANGLRIYRHDSNGGCPTKPNEKCGGHAILVIGYDKVNQRYLVKNSYGPGSNYWIPYFTDDGITPVLWNGQVITRVRHTNLEAQREAEWIGVWNMDHDGWIGKLIIRRTRRSPNENNVYQGAASTPLVSISNPPRIGSYYSGGKHYPVFGETDGSGRKLVFYIDFNTNDNSYSDNVGDVTGKAQRFEVYLFSDADLAAGVTYWNHKRFGTFLSRTYMDIPHGGVSAFTVGDWKKFWELNIGDRQKGFLQISDIVNGQPQGKYIQDGKNYPISGIASDNYLGLKVELGGGNSLYLNLLYHTREKDFVSGFTKSEEGVYGVKKTLSLPLKKPIMIPRKKISL